MAGLKSYRRRRPRRASPSVMRSGNRSGSGNGPELEAAQDAVKAGLKNATKGVACKNRSRLRMKTLKVKPVRIADDDGSNKTGKADMSVTKRVFKKAAIDVQEISETVLKKTSYKEMSHLGKEAKKDLWKDVASTDHAALVTVETFNDGSKVGRKVTGGGYTWNNARAGMAMMVHDGGSWLAAHELGHAVGGKHSHQTDKSGNNTVMKPTGDPDVAGTENVSKKLGRVWRRHGLTKGRGAKVCPDYSD